MIALKILNVKSVSADECNLTNLLADTTILRQKARDVRAR